MKNYSWTIQSSIQSPMTTLRKIMTLHLKIRFLHLKISIMNKQTPNKQVENTEHPPGSGGEGPTEPTGLEKIMQEVENTKQPPSNGGEGPTQPTGLEQPQQEGIGICMNQMYRPVFRTFVDQYVV